MRPALLGAALAAGAAGCSALPPGQLPVAQGLQPRFPDPEPLHLQPTRHFIVRAGDPEVARRASTLAEEAYRRIMAHTGLWSFRPRGLYPIVVYRDQEEFLSKTGQPAWSGGVAVGHAIFTFPGEQLRDTVTHEVSHLVVHEYVGPGTPRWLNEGLAVHEEIEASPPEVREPRRKTLQEARDRPMTFSAMAGFEPSTEKDRLVHRWYLQSASVAAFLIERGGTGSVARFLQVLRSGASVDQALRQAFPTLCDDLESLERAWLRQ